MIKQSKWLIGVAVVTFAIFWFYKEYAQKPLPSVRQFRHTPAVLTVRAPASVPALPQAKIASVKNINPPDWQTPLEENLRDLGGADLKEIKIVRERTIDWNNRGEMIQAEAVKITLKNQNDELTNFRALVDSNTGKILQTWDQPVYDAINPRENFGLKLDPRYHP